MIGADQDGGGGDDAQNTSHTESCAAGMSDRPDPDQPTARSLARFSESLVDDDSPKGESSVDHDSPKGRQGIIILRHRWQRAVFVAGLVGAVVLAAVAAWMTA